MDMKLANNIKEWNEEEKYEVIEEVAFGRNCEHWNTQFNFHSPLKEKLRQQKPAILELATRDKHAQANTAFVSRAQHQIVRPTPTEQDISNDSFFEKHNHEKLVSGAGGYGGGRYCPVPGALQGV